MCKSKKLRKEGQTGNLPMWRVACRKRKKKKSEKIQKEKEKEKA